MTVGQADAPALYVFNRPEGGWMIVSADDVAIPLVGYSDSGSIDPADLPDNFKGWLDLCADGIRMAS
ncbi:Spi family protease inhibitor, partial [Bacillus pumilus]|uniref:Spi family protease inhibitor n=2 Tax=Bacteria TaxID=2 RepID=UPI0021B66060